MSTEANWQRALLLFEQQRFAMAVDALRRVLAEDPDHAPAHALLALNLGHLDRHDEALREARTAVAVDPGMDFGFRVLAVVHLLREELDEAQAAIETAIRLDPDDVDHHGVLAQIRLRQKRWQDALDAADRGLALDARDVDCLNLRSVALARLGRRAEATDTVDASLARDPDNPHTHQVRGFALLHRGDAKGALHHFQEALRRDPTLEGAREGLLEALKARNPIYRVVLAWFLWLDRHGRGRQLQILIGLWLAARLGSEGLESAGYPTAADVVGYSWVGFVLLTTCAVPLCNLMLLLHPLGKHALDRSSRNHALLLGAGVLALLGVGGHAVWGSSIWSALGWLFWLVMLLPLSGLGLFHSGWARWVLQVFCVGIVAAWVWWAWSLEARVEAVRVDQHLPKPGSMLARIPTRDPELLWLVDLQGDLVLAAAWSTWFVLLAPKGRRRSVRGGHG